MLGEADAPFTRVWNATPSGHNTPNTRTITLVDNAGATIWQAPSFSFDIPGHFRLKDNPMLRNMKTIAMGGEPIIR